MQTQNLPAGVYLVATPIGNVLDITLRALYVLECADIIAAEDTRRTRVLLNFYDIKTPIMPYNDHNWERSLPAVLQKIGEGRRVALVSDAGTPLVSDPGFRLVKQCLQENLPLYTIPGPSSVTAALTLSGLPSQPFHFFGFLPAKPLRRRGVFQEAAEYPGTLLFFESPKRVPSALRDALAVLGNRRAAIARELTKTFEEVRRESLAELLQHYDTAPPLKGEVVFLVEGVSPQEVYRISSDRDSQSLLETSLKHFSLREAVQRVHQETSVSKTELYRHALRLRAETKTE